VVDDGSTDLYTRQALAHLDAPGVRLVRTENHGLAAARNTGIAATTAPYLVTLDADDRLAPTYLEKTAARLDDDGGLGFVTTGMQAFGAASYSWLPPPCSVENALTRGTAHQSSLFRRTLWEALGGFSDAAPGCEDLDFWLSAMSAGFRGDVVPELLLLYRVRADSMHQVAVERGTILDSMSALFRKHRETIRGLGPSLLVEKDRFRLELEDQLREGERRRQQAEERLRELERELDSLGVARHDRVNWGDLARVAPMSTVWGLDRGMPVDRHYIRRFLEACRADIQGRVLEVKDSGYTLNLGGARVSEAAVLDVDGANPNATVVADLTQPSQMPEGAFDCFILTQTLHIVYDLRGAVANAVRALKPGGVLLCTIPAVSRVNDENGGLDAGDFWRLTQAAVLRLFADVVPVEHVSVVTHGNVRTCAAFLYGLAAEELRPEDLDYDDPWFPLLHCIRVVKPSADGSASRERHTRAAAER
jgi:GT2 family glycosyltransferase/SAM-dependent methyltransferase